MNFVLTFLFVTKSVVKNKTESYNTYIYNIRISIQNIRNKKKYYRTSAPQNIIYCLDLAASSEQIIQRT